MTTSIYRSVGQINEAMTRVYTHMFLAVLTSMVVASLVASSPALMAVLFGTALKWVVLLAPLGAIFLLIPFLSSNPSKTGATVALHSFAVLMALSMSVVFAVYTSLSIVSAFMGAAILFGVMSLYGYFTKQNLDSIGKYLFIALIAIILVSLVNLFIGSTMIQMIVSAISVIVFMGLTAYDTQTIREMVSLETSPGVEVAGALTLYLNFINILMSLLNLFGDKE
jgi:FtsH-binding integral membrane protein